MRRALVQSGVARQAERPVRSIACLAFVGLLAAAFWTGASAIFQMAVQLGAGRF